MRALVWVPIVFFVISSLALAQGSWPMFRGSPSRTGYTNETGDLGSFQVVMEYFASNGIVGTPAVEELNGYGTMEIVVPLDKKSGSAADGIVVLGSSGGVLWSFKPEGAVHSSPTVADLDGDGDKDIVFGTNDGEIFALDGATGVELWSIDNKVGAFRSSPLVYDLDNDNNAEVFIGNERGVLYGIDAESSIVEWTYQTNGEISSSPTLANLDEDGDMEIVFGSEDGYVYAVNGDGTTSWELDVGAPVIYSSPAVFPSGDRIAIGTYDGRLLFIKGGRVEKTYDVGVSIVGSPAIGISEGKTVIVFGGAEEKDMHGLYLKDSRNSIYCIDSEGKLLWSVPTDGWGAFSSATLADIDRDGGLEAVIGSREGRLYAIGVSSGEVEWSYLDGTGMYASPVVVDIDGDDDLEVVIGYRFSNQLQLLDSFEKPDLFIESVEFSDYFPKRGDELQINVTVKNRGNSPSGTADIALYRRSPVLDEQIGTIQVPGIGERENESVVFKWKTEIPPGEASIYLELDPENKIEESVEDNNVYEKSFPDDLQISEWIFPDELRRAEARIKVELGVTLAHRGRSDFSNVKVDLQLDNGSEVSVLDSKTVEIKANWNVDVVFSFNFEPSEVNQTLSVVIDPDDKIEEFDEENNVKAWNLQAEKAVAPVKPVTPKPAQKSKIDNDLVTIILVIVVIAIIGKKASGRVKKKAEKKKDAEKKEKKKTEKEVAVEYEKARTGKAEEIEEPEETGVKVPEKVAEAEERAVGAKRKLVKAKEKAIETGGEKEGAGEIIMIGEGATPGKPAEDLELQELYERKKKIEHMMEIAKRKYYKRQLSQESYQDLVVRNQEKIIEIEAEIEKRKAGETD